MTSGETLVAEEFHRIEGWERKGFKFTRRGGHLLKDRNGAYHIRARVMTKLRGCGLAVGYMMFMASRDNERNVEPWMVEYGKQVMWFMEDSVRKATFMEYLFRTKGAFGGTPWPFVGLLAAACLGLTTAMWWLGPAVLIAFLIFTYGNYKLWLR